jgi:hypothetical protein
VPSVGVSTTRPPRYRHLIAGSRPDASPRRAARGFVLTGKTLPYSSGRAPRTAQFIAGFTGIVRKTSTCARSPRVGPTAQPCQLRRYRPVGPGERPGVGRITVW